MTFSSRVLFKNDWSLLADMKVNYTEQEKKWKKANVEGGEWDKSDQKSGRWKKQNKKNHKNQGY